MNRRFGKTDFIVLAVVFAVLVFAVIFTAFKRKQGEFVVISLDGEVYREVPLEKDQEIEIKKEGITINVLDIREGKADMRKRIFCRRILLP